MRVYPLVSVVNESTVISDVEVQHIVAALQYQVSYHFKPYWDSGAYLYWNPNKFPIPNTWQLVFLDDSDQAGALGYHDDTAVGGFPMMKIFAKTDRDNNLSASVTAGHELLEALVDPWINLAAQVRDTQFYGYEVGDPVEGDQFGYSINIGGGISILCTDFVLPYWFIPGSPGPKYDYMGHCTKPLEVLQDGYVSIYTDGQGWNQYQQKGESLIINVDPDDHPRYRVRS